MQQSPLQKKNTIDHVPNKTVDLPPSLLRCWQEFLTTSPPLCRSAENKALCSKVSQADLRDTMPGFRQTQETTVGLDALDITKIKKIYEWEAQGECISVLTCQGENHDLFRKFQLDRADRLQQRKSNMAHMQLQRATTSNLVPELGFVNHSETTAFGIPTPGEMCVFAESNELHAFCPHLALA